MLFSLLFSSNPRRRIIIDLKHTMSFYNYGGWAPNKKNVIIIHGFNGAETDKFMVLLRNGKLVLFFDRESQSYVYL